MGIGERFPLDHEAGVAISTDEALDRFLNYVRQKGIELYSAQEEALLELFHGCNVILKTPTGSGKSLVATALHYYSLTQGRRSFYTSPVKALVNEKFFSLCRDFGPEKVGLITGDAAVNRQAPIVCCTAEIIANMGLREGERASVDDLIIDEFHYYADRDRGMAWQIPLLTLPQSRFLLMSATLGPSEIFEERLTALTKLKTVTVSSLERPVPLEYRYSEQPFDETIADLLAEQQAPVYIVNFTQKDCNQMAQAFLSTNFCTKEEKNRISEHLKDFVFTSPFGKEIKKYLKHGIALHHAGLLPKYRILVETLAQKGLLKLICGTDTLGVGVNIPIRSVVLTRLSKYDGKKTSLLSIRDFHQICGRAGRKGFDNKGLVIVQAPAHVIENKRLEMKAKLAKNPRKKIQKVRPPEKGFVPWNEETFKRYLSDPIEPLRSQFQVTHGLLLSVLSRDDDGCQALKKIYKDCHESSAAKAHHRRRGFQMLRALIARKIIDILPQHERLTSPVRVNMDLQEEFSLTETLSLYLLDSLKFLDPMAEDYALNLLSVVESIVENPKVILNRQVDKLRKEALVEMKSEGLDFEERIEKLDEIDYPKPLGDFIYQTFNSFSDKHPWLGQENIRPKSIARDMFESFQSFPDYVRLYSLEKSEGILLRYVSNVYKVLVQTVPDHAKNDHVDDCILYLKMLIKNTDSSLLDEWSKMQNPEHKIASTSTQTSEEELEDFEDKKVFQRHLRNKVYRFLRHLSYSQYDQALALLHSTKNYEETHTWSTENLEQIMVDYYSEHKNLLIHMEARNLRHIKITDEESLGTTRVELTMVDDDRANDWSLCFLTSMEASKNGKDPILYLESIKPIEF